MNEKCSMGVLSGLAACLALPARNIPLPWVGDANRDADRLAIRGWTCREELRPAVATLGEGEGRSMST